MSLLPKPHTEADVPSFPVLVHKHPLRGWLTFMRLSLGPGPWSKEDMDKRADIYYRILAREAKASPPAAPIPSAPTKKKKKRRISEYFDDEAEEKPRKPVRRRLTYSTEDEESSEEEEDLDGFVVRG